MIVVSAIGTAAMLWVGGSIVIDGLDALGWGAIAHEIHDVAAAAVRSFGIAGAVIDWTLTGTLDGIFGFALSLLAIPLVR